mmetsp:Transcript_3753/g.8292  ORF Transcript_3753/g.8292 Transcript_3753/m.8292 type:complete len:105 (+) Transcript_3753:1198-1512(+)
MFYLVSWESSVLAKISNAPCVYDAGFSKTPWTNTRFSFWPVFLLWLNTVQYLNSTVVNPADSNNSFVLSTEKNLAIVPSPRTKTGSFGAVDFRDDGGNRSMGMS